ncbi:hypothetical protein MW887_005633 [Aspergillus wentii]|nr:hypothetical protein MW887_005633 [Aspergillus wentii]
MAALANSLIDMPVSKNSKTIVKTRPRSRSIPSSSFNNEKARIAAFFAAIRSNPEPPKPEKPLNTATIQLRLVKGSKVAKPSSSLPRSRKLKIDSILYRSARKTLSKHNIPVKKIYFPSNKRDIYIDGIKERIPTVEITAVRAIPEHHWRAAIRDIYDEFTEAGYQGIQIPPQLPEISIDSFQPFELFESCTICLAHMAKSSSA